MNSEDRTANFLNQGRQRPSAAPQPGAQASEAPLEVEPDADDERPGYGWQWNQSRACEATEREQSDRQLQAERAEVHRAAELEAARAAARSCGDTASADTSMDSSLGGQANHMSDMLRWALDSIHHPSLAAADWLARDIAPDCASATSLLTDPRVSLEHLSKAKDVFKTMRIVGEKSADRRVGARMYAAAIAAALVRHRKFITSQSDEALKRAFQGLLDDKRMPAVLRDLAGMALCAMADKTLLASPDRPRNTAASRSMRFPLGNVDEPRADSPPAPMSRGMPRPQSRKKRA
jgi:hypothetical protein